MPDGRTDLYESMKHHIQHNYLAGVNILAKNRNYSPMVGENFSLSRKIVFFITVLHIFFRFFWVIFFLCWFERFAEKYVFAKPPKLFPNGPKIKNHSPMLFGKYASIFTPALRSKFVIKWAQWENALVRFSSVNIRGSLIVSLRSFSYKYQWGPQ